MKKSKFTEEQIAFTLHQAETGVSVEEACRKTGVSQATFCAWKNENRKLKQLVVDLSLDKAMLQDAIKKSLKPDQRKTLVGHLIEH